MVNPIGVFLAGGLGCLSRYLIGLWILPIMGLPIATLIVNVCGGFLAGVIASKFPQFKSFLLVGFLGGFTTFSSFSLECLSFVQNQQIFTALAYIFAKCCFKYWGVLAGVCGLWVKTQNKNIKSYFCLSFYLTKTPIFPIK